MRGRCYVGASTFMPFTSPRADGPSGSHLLRIRGVQSLQVRDTSVDQIWCGQGLSAPLEPRSCYSTHRIFADIRKGPAFDARDGFIIVMCLGADAVLTLDAGLDIDRQPPLDVTLIHGDVLVVANCSLQARVYFIYIWFTV